MQLLVLRAMLLSSVFSDEDEGGLPRDGVSEGKPDRSLEPAHPILSGRVTNGGGKRNLGRSK